MATYDRKAAAAYCIKWAMDRNPDWNDDTPRGGDCTNFVSQCLFAGGWTMVSRGTIVGSERDGGSWYSGKAGSGIHERSRTWGAAANFTNFLTYGGRAQPCREKDLQMGDVIQLVDFDIIHHTMFVTGVLPDILRRPSVFVSAHTYDVVHKPLRLIGAEKILYWHIKDEFEEKVSFIMPRVS